MPTYYDMGHWQPLVSLAGVKARPGRPLRLGTEQYTLTASVALVLKPNPVRLFALITNDGDTDVELKFSDNADTADFYHYLRPRGSFQLDQNFPWVGGVTAYGTGSVSVSEASIEGA